MNQRQQRVWDATYGSTMASMGFLGDVPPAGLSRCVQAAKERADLAVRHMPAAEGARTYTADKVGEVLMRYTMAMIKTSGPDNPMSEARAIEWWHGHREGEGG